MHSTHNLVSSQKMASPQVVNISLPSLPQGWAGEKDFKIVGALSAATKRNVQPVGPHFLAHARRVCARILVHYLTSKLTMTQGSSQPYLL